MLKECHEILILGDLHFGDQRYQDKPFQSKIEYFQKIIFPLIKKRNIKIVYQLGDFFDNREYLSNKQIAEIQEKIIDFFESEKIDLYVLVGNHDCYYRNHTLFPNTCTTLLSKFQHIHVVDEIKTWQHYGQKFIAFPWIHDHEKFDMLKELEQRKCDNNTIVLGHFDICQIQLNKTNISQNGFMPNCFKNTKMVLSGHYHVKSSYKNIHYVGTPYPLNRGDHAIDKGVHILSKNKLEFIPNNFSPQYHKLILKQNNDTIEILKSTKEGCKPINIDKAKKLSEHHYIDIEYSNINNYKDLEKIITKIKENAYAPIKEYYIENLEHLNKHEIENIEQYDSFVDFISNYINKVTAKNHSKLDTENITREFCNLYKKALGE